MSRQISATCCCDDSDFDEIDAIFLNRSDTTSCVSCSAVRVRTREQAASRIPLRERRQDQSDCVSLPQSTAGEPSNVGVQCSALAFDFGDARAEVAQRIRPRQHRVDERVPVERGRIQHLPKPFVDVVLGRGAWRRRPRLGLLPAHMDDLAHDALASVAEHKVAAWHHFATVMGPKRVRPTEWFAGFGGRAPDADLSRSATTAAAVQQNVRAASRLLSQCVRLVGLQHQS